MRLFVALDFPGEVRQALGELIAQLKPLCRGARWVRPEGMHVTLKFIGHADAEKLDAIRAALAAIHSPAPVEMLFRGLGFFPSERRPRVLWCGIEASPNLARLAGDIERALEPLEISPEARPFAPHLTLARLDSSEAPSGGLDELARIAAEMKSYDFGAARETEFHLFESIRKSSGAEYRYVASYPLVKEPA